MSLEKLEFARSWENSADFPTFEENETKVREDLQYHPNAIRDFINGLIDTLLAEGVLEITRTDGATMKYVRLNGDKVLETSVDGEHWEATGSSGHVIIGPDGAVLPQRSRLKFTNGTVADENGVTVITGIKGDRGEQGEKGDKGDKGDTGSRGLTGPSIVPSVDIDGVMHFSMQDTATAPQSVSVRGPQGPQGVQGAQGEQGARGPQGIQGVQGVQGPVGPQGERGPAGIQGAQGPTGPQGERGADGADGRSFVLQDVYETLGELKAAYPTGNEFAYQVISEGREVFIWSELANDWVSVGQLQGPVGPAGPQGSVGPEGPQGPAGPQGVQGVQGAQGAIGPEGPQGPAGVAGKDGQSAYSAAAANGYTGTETAFNNALVALPTHIENKNNPHGVTAKQIGAIPNGGTDDYDIKGNLQIGEGLEVKQTIHSSYAVEVGGGDQGGFATMTPDEMGIHNHYGHHTFLYSSGSVGFSDGDWSVQAGADDWNDEPILQDGVAHMFFCDEDGNNIRLRGIANPAKDLDVANKEYVDGKFSEAAGIGHKHSASDITSGTLPVARGGTGAISYAQALYNIITGATALTSTGLDASDRIGVSDTSASLGKYVTIANLGAYLSGVGGLASQQYVDAKTTTYTATVTTTWTASGNYFYQDVAVSGILAADNPIVDINPSSGAGHDSVVLYSEAMCKVFRIQTSANTIRLWATEQPTIAFPIQLKVVR